MTIIRLDDQKSFRQPSRELLSGLLPYVTPYTEFVRTTGRVVRISLERVLSYSWHPGRLAVFEERLQQSRQEAIPD